MDKIFADIKNSVGSAVKKSGELVEITKVKLAIADTKNEIKSKLAALGEEVYFAQKNDLSPESAAELIGELDELYAILEAQEAKLATLKKQKVCPNCDAPSDSEAVFCSRCGSKFSDDVDENDDDYVTANMTDE